MSVANDVVMLRGLIELRELAAARTRAELGAGERSRATARAALDLEEAALRSHQTQWMKKIESGSVLDPAMLGMFGALGDRITERNANAATHVQAMEAEVVALRSAARESQSMVNALEAVRASLGKVRRHEAAMQDSRRLEDRAFSEGDDNAN